MTQEEKDQKRADIIREFTNIEPYKLVKDMTVLELYELIKLAVNRKKQDY